MSTVSAIVISPNTRPMSASIRYVSNRKGDTGIEAQVRALLGGSADIVRTPHSLGDFYHVANASAENKFANVVRSHGAEEGGGGDDDTTTTTKTLVGQCVLVGTEKPSTVGKDVVSAVKALWRSHQSSGKSKKAAAGPKRPRRATDFYTSHYQRTAREALKAAGEKADFVTLNKEARSKWNNELTAEGRAPFEKMAAEDKARYERELAEFHLVHPPDKKPPVRPRSAYNMYCRANPKTSGDGWKAASDEDRKRFADMALQDKERYQSELAEFRAWCEANGKDYEYQVARKRRKVGHPADLNAAK
jgi:hypothetical protein